MTRKIWEYSEDDIYRLKIHQFTKLHDIDRDEEDNVGPMPRSGHRIECTNTCLYSIGGFLPNEARRRQLLHEAWRYDFLSKTWTKLNAKNLPRELASCATVLSGNVLFLSGGTGFPFGGSLNESLHFCNLPTHGNSITFEEIIPSTQVSPFACYGHSMAINGNRLYTVGGTSGIAYSMDVYEFNLQTREWKKLYDTNENDGRGPPPRYRHEIICYKNKLYVFGGGTSVTAYTLEEIPVFNLNTGAWEYVTTFGDNAEIEEVFPAKRKCHGCAQHPILPSIVYISGGANEERFLNDTWRIDLDTMKWTRIVSLNLPYGLQFHSIAATPDGRMIVFGGITDKGTSERTADLHSAWITVPKLADACWEAILHYIRKGDFTLPEDVRSLGLPKRYENRLLSSNLKLTNFSK